MVDGSWLYWMVVLPMTTTCACQFPTIRFHQLNGVSNFHPELNLEHSAALGMRTLAPGRFS